jgi:predicted metal-dependent RNase
MFRYPQYCQPCTCCRNKSKNVRLRHQYVNGSTQQTRERRNVIATGMKRFETKVEIRNQPQVESLSKSVTCILGGNPSEYTINGTNCYLVGCGTSRILVDCAEKYIGNSAFMKNLEKAMEITGTKSICAVIITHLHHGTQLGVLVYPLVAH